MIFTGIRTEVSWIKDLADVPVLGGFFTFLLISIPAVLVSAALHMTIPALSDDLGFTKAMLL